MEIKDRIITIVAQVMKIDVEALGQDTSKQKPWDSFQNVEIIFAVEDEFGITLSQDDIAGLKTLNDLVNIVKGYVNET